MKFPENAAADALDFFSLRLFQDLARSENFTATARNLGLTQSAVSRQIQRLEEQIGTALFERTTRRVRLSEAGRVFLGQTDSLLHEWSNSIRTLRETFLTGRRRIRLAVSETISFSYLPGFFSGYRKAFPDDRIEISQLASDELIAAIRNQERDIGVVADRDASAKKKLPSEIEVLHRFEDRFVGIAPPDFEGDFFDAEFVSLSQHSETGRRVGAFLKAQGSSVRVAVEAHNFDFAINLVSLGFGNSVVPKRALALYGKRKRVAKIELKKPGLARELVLIARRDHKRAAHLDAFLEAVHF